MDASERNAFIDSLGLKLDATYKPKPYTKDAMLDWSVTISQAANPRVSLTVDYHTGIGHIPDYKPAKTVYEQECIERVFTTGRTPVSVNYRSIFGKPLPAPKLIDVLYCLVNDATALDYTFEEWCREFNYDTDSRKAKATYRACLENGIKLRQLLGDKLSQLQEAMQDY